ncbi:hypothetical protein CCACVL1_18981 [Corchorus capsularis]|uniref:Uncharacterized protein n=1 Tax=Corchorus capsularis TaxID=210143 RepID=A0A1R3HJA7_COCAP|nr:hypothetical protein CCACVL1_18981 [Corchorus capsularis]
MAAFKERQKMEEAVAAELAEQ